MPNDLFAANNVVAQPTDLFQQNGIAPQSQSQTNPSLVPRVAGDIDAGILDAARGAVNLPSTVGNMVAGAINPAWRNTFPAVSDIPGNLINQGLGAINPALANTVPAVSQMNFGNMMGVNNPNLGDKFVQGAASFAPFGAIGDAAYAAQNLPKAASYLSGLAQRAPSQALGGGLFGLTQNPSDPATGSVVGMGLGGLNAAIPGIGQMADLIRPQKYANNVIDNIGAAVKAGNDQYQPVINAVGNNSIYSNTPQAQGAYAAVDDDITNNYPRSLKILNTNFTQNPTFQNAHELQSDLGGLIGKLQQNDAQGTLSYADRNTMENLQDARQSLRTDMDQYLQSVSPQLSDQYANATLNWKNNVAPYLGQKDIATSVNNSTANNDGTGNTLNPYMTPEKTLAALNKVKGNPNGLADQINTLTSRIGLRNLAQRATGIGLGMKLFPASEEAGGIIGGLLGPQIAKNLSSSIGNNPLSNGLGASFSAISPYLRQSLMANANQPITTGLSGLAGNQ